MKVAVHPLTADPTAAWRELSQTQKVVKITAKLPTTEAASNKVRALDFYRSEFSLRENAVALTSKGRYYLPRYHLFRYLR